MSSKEREYRTVVMYGAERGKSHHAADIARALGCKEVIDGWAEMGLSNGYLPPVTEGALHVTSEFPIGINRLPDDVLIMPFNAALAAAFVLGAV